MENMTPFNRAILPPCEWLVKLCEHPGGTTHSKDGV